MKKVIYFLLLVAISTTTFGKTLNLICNTSTINQTVVIDFDKKIIYGLNEKWNKGEFSDGEISWYQSSEYGNSFHKLNRYTGILSVKILDGPLLGVGSGVMPWKCSSVSEKKF